MNGFVRSGLALLALATTASLAAADPAPPAQPRLGINLSGPADYGSELPFVDVFRLSRAWISQRQGESWGKGPKLALDARGWVTRLEPGCYAETPLCTLEGGHYPAGEYVVLYDGKGTIELWGAAKAKSSRPGRMTIDVDPAKGGFFLRLKETDPADPVRNIRVLMPGTEATYRDNPWNPAFLKLWKGVACARFMDLMHTNGSEVSTWSDRPTPDDATFTTKGVPVELLTDLANRLGADAWFCMPHKADDGYVREFAKAVRKSLDPSRKAYVEYSNEVWNGQFPQNRYAAEQGRKLGFAEKPWEAAWFYTAHRSVEIFAIWEREFGGTDRLVRVLPSQAANAYVSRQVTSFHDAYKHADALAIAPYLSLNVGPQTKPNVAEVSRWSAAQVLDHLESRSLPESARWIRENKQVADQYGLRLVAYEGGQHMVGIQGGENDESLTRVLHAANADPRIEAIYTKCLETWDREGGDLFCHFSSVSPWSKWGSWGTLQYLDEDPQSSPKYRALAAWARSHGQTLGE